jgi:hypothetical protein
MSVVGPEFEQLKRFNLAELRDVANENTHKAADTTDRDLGQGSTKDIGAGE